MKQESNVCFLAAISLSSLIARSVLVGARLHQGIPGPTRLVDKLNEVLQSHLADMRQRFLRTSEAIAKRRTRVARVRDGLELGD